MKISSIIVALALITLPARADTVTPGDNEVSNITFVNATHEQITWAEVSLLEIKKVIHDQNLVDVECRDDVDVKIYIMPESELDALRHQGFWGQKIKNMPTVSGIFSVAVHPRTVSNMYLVNDRPGMEISTIFAHEFAHAYFISHCLHNNEGLDGEMFSETVEEKVRAILESSAHSK